MAYALSMMKEDFYREFGRLLRDGRKAAGLSQTDLANVIGLTRTSISNIEKGRQKVLLHTFHRILHVLNLQPVELLPPPESADAKPPVSLEGLADKDREFVERGLGQLVRE